MKSTHLINEFRDLISNYLRHYSPDEAQYRPRNAICITIYNTVRPADKIALSREQAVQMLLPLFNEPVPVLPNPNSAADEADQIRAILGQEFSALILDGTTAWPDNALGAAAGCVKAGGTLFLLMPHGLTASHSPSPYEVHLKQRLKRYMSPVPKIPGIWSIRPLDIERTKAQAPIIDNTQPAPWLAEQSAVVTRLANRCSNHEKSLDLLLAKRGRGKSAALGRVVNALNPQDNLTPAPDITLTASHPDQVITTQQHTGPHPLRHTPLDVAMRSTGDILMVDEAGSVPLPVLKQLAANYTHSIFAGTVDGYEGTGRALAVRLASAWHQTEASASQAQNHTLNHPIRWPAGDPVEAMVQDVLRLGLVETAETNSKFDVLALSDVHHQRVSPDQLLNDETLLDEVFSLLLQAHYQTTSKDLKHLLNQQQLSLWVQTHKGTLTGACLVAHEGDLSDDVQQGIVQGVRRPAHQRLPMLLHRQCNKREILNAHYWRVVRIAIEPKYHRQGLGACFLNALQAEAQRLANLDDTAPRFIGASFGASVAGYDFWQNSGFHAIHWGFRLNPRSGQRALAVIKPIDEEETVHQAHHYFTDSAKTLHELRRLKPQWLDILYPPHSFDDTLLGTLTQPTICRRAVDSSLEQQTDPLRLSLWKSNQLGLHDVWGPLARAMGGAKKLAALEFPTQTTAKQLTKTLQNRI